MNESYQKNTKLGRWAVENQKEKNVKLKENWENLKEIGEVAERQRRMRLSL